ncbi:hypothetical protein EMN47_05905 [Prolixibacteraceae bacterium JC049]|nr:hypothetical protein [Prolixibacteraceae bacterium JC049]
MKKVQLFSISESSPDGISIHTVEHSKVNSMAENIQCMDSFILNNVTYIISFKKDSGDTQIYEACNKQGEFLNLVKENTLAFSSTHVAILHSENNVLCLSYNEKTGYLSILDISDNLKLNIVCTLNIGKGISTLKSFIYRWRMFFIAYNIETGHVDKYEVLINKSTSSISTSKVWDDKWAQGWTRFSFFQLGAENFFIKTNIKYVKVNIDHFMDDADEGSHPVLNIDAPAQMRSLNNVSAFTDQKGFPFFAAYSTDGNLSFNRIYGNCLGWDMVSLLNSEPGRSLLLPFKNDKQNYLLVY